MGEYASLALLFVFALGLAGGIAALSHVLGPKRPNPAKLAPYECGVDQATLPRQRFSVKFFVVAIVFLLFDVEIAILYPWAALFRSLVSEGLRTFAIVEGLMFIGILTVGLVYVWQSGGLEWEE